MGLSHRKLLFHCQFWFYAFGKQNKIAESSELPNVGENHFTLTA